MWLIGWATPFAQVVLAVVAAQVVVQVDERVLPVDAGQAELAHVGEERVRQRAALAEEAVGAPGHAVADREVALLLPDRQQRVRQLDGPVGEQRRQQRQLRLVDVPHRAMSNTNDPTVGQNGLSSGAKHGLISEW